MKKALKKIEVFFNNNITLFFLVFLVFVLFVNTAWVVMDNYAPRGNGKEFVRELTEVRGMGYLEQLKTLYFNRIDDPPLIELTVLPYYMMFGYQTKNELVVNSLYLAILLISIYKIGGIIYSRKSGFLAAVIASSIPIIISLSKTTYREFHLLCFVSLSFWLMLRTEYFSKTKEAIIFGLGTGLALMVKYESAIFLFPQSAFYAIIALYYAYKTLQKSRKHHMIRVIKNIAIALAVILVVSGLWYYLHTSTILQKTKARFENAGPEIGKKDFPVFSMDNILFFWEYLLHPNLGLLFWAIFMVAFLNKLLTRKKPEEYVLLSAFIVPYLIFLFIPIKDNTKLLPTYFVIPVLISEFLFRLKMPGGIKKAFLSMTAVYCLAIVLSSLVPIPFAAIPIVQEGNLRLARIENYGAWNLRLPSPEASPGEKLFYSVENHLKSGRPVNILLLSNSHTVYWDLRYFSHIYDSEYRITAEFRLSDGYYLKWPANGIPPDFSVEDLIAGKRADFVLLFLPSAEKEKNTGTIEEYKPSYDIITLEAFNGNYELVDEIEDESDTVVKVYRLK